MRVILHADLDCFYCQVEERRLGISGLPLCVQQWNSVIAVNYEARSFGITRHSSTEECLEKCPAILFVHVPTYSLHDPSQPQYYDAWSQLKKPPHPDRRHHKACLDPYRKAGALVLQCMVRAVSFGDLSPIVEKASVDEAFLDITRLVDERLWREYGIKDEDADLSGIECLAWEEIGQPACPSDTDLPGQLDTPLTYADLRLFLGGLIAAEMRAAVREELGYTISAGIAPNKLLAKLASAMHKPNQQTFILPRMVEAVMSRTPLSKLRSFGGKLGDRLTDGREDAMASSLWHLTAQSLGERVGDAALGPWIHGAIRGIDETPVSNRETRDQFMAAKALQPPLRNGDWAGVQRWTRLLLAELSMRLEEEGTLHHRWPTKLTLGRSGATRTLPMPVGSWDLYQSDRMEEVCMREWRRWDQPSDPFFPCRHLAISVSRFRDQKGPRDQSLDKYLRKRTAGSDPPEVEEAEVEVLVEVVAPPKKPKGLLAFFKPVTKSKNEWTCPECQERLTMETQQEHLDYHLALSLSRESV